MDIKWYTLWFNCINGIETELTSHSQLSARDALMIRASAQRAILKRIANRKPKRTYEARRASIASYELYQHVAKYYELYYVNGIKQHIIVKEDEATAVDFYTHSRTAKTKRRIYLHRKYDEIIMRELKSFNKIHSAFTDDNFLHYIYSKLPLYSFTDEERKLWKSIYTFATTDKLEFTAVKRSDRRTKKSMTCTYLEFAKWYADNSNEYSCTSRFFVPLFMKCCKSDTSSQKVDELLRYDTDINCFGDSDITDIVNMSVINSQNDFFTALMLIKNTSQKK